MVPTFTMLSGADIRARREALLRQVGMTHEELRAKSEHYQLTPDEDAVLREIEDLEFLESGRAE